jgi:hypothetical protein
MPIGGGIGILAAIRSTKVTNLKRALALVLIFCCAPLPLLAQEKPSANEQANAAAPGAKPTRVEVVFRDGSKVRMAAAATLIEVATKYGTLSIPLTEVCHIRLQPRLTDEANKQIAEAIEQMGNESFPIREAAGPKVRAMGVAAFPQLRLATRHSNPEIRRRAGELLEEMEKQIPEEEQAVAEHDVVETVAFTMSGRVLTENIKAQSQFLGNVEVALAQVESVRSLNVPQDARIEVDAATYASATRWLETGIEIEPRDRILATATGQVDLYPADGGTGTYLSTPKGKILAELAGRPTNESSPPGTLLGRVGTQGKEFVVGERYSGVQHGGGQLFLRISPAPWGAHTGAYSVKVAITRSEQSADDEPGEEK